MMKPFKCVMFIWEAPLHASGGLFQSCQPWPPCCPWVTFALLLDIRLPTEAHAPTAVLQSLISPSLFYIKTSMINIVLSVNT